MTLDALPGVLQWTGSSAPAGQVHADYADRVAAGLGRLLRTLEPEDMALAGRLRAALEGAASGPLVRVLLAPESTARLLWRSAVDQPRLTARFLLESLLVEDSCRAAPPERPRLEFPVGGGRTIWSALGDVRIQPTGEIARTSPVGGRVPLDVGSPYATQPDGPPALHQRGERSPLDQSEQSAVAGRLEAAYEGISCTSDVASKVVQDFIKVLVLRKNEGEPFSTGTLSPYVGRVVFVNPHWDHIEASHLAEGLVHEAIHGLLFMEEFRRPWMLEDRLYEQVPRAVSPWTGRALPLRSFLHAAFVWYGLAHFWSLALLAGTFPEGRARAALAKAQRGFLQRPLSHYVDEGDRGDVSPHVWSVIARCQADVVAACVPLPGDALIGSAEVA